MRNAIFGLLGLVLLLLSAPVWGAQGTQSVASPMGGNGHNITFDGRLFVVRRGGAAGSATGGWYGMVLRPQNVQYDGNGFPNVSAGALSTPFKLTDSANTENALAMCEVDAANTPYACNAGGAADANGAFDCYDLIVFDSDALSPSAAMRRRTMKVWIRDPKSSTATVDKVEVGPLEAVSQTLWGIEPTVTRDGKLMVWQGHPDNDGTQNVLIDILMYSTNANPCAASGWSAPKSITGMFDDANVNGVYPLGEKRLRSNDGSVYDNDEMIHGAYPWLFADGEAVIFTAANMPCQAPDVPAGCGPRRNAVSVLGYPTNWGVDHIDGGINPSREDIVRLFFSSPGPNTFDEIPGTLGADVWPFFGSNTSNYTEISFDTGLDGSYVGLWNMNELVTKDGNLDAGETPDTSGYFNTGTLKGGAVLPVANNAPRGKAVVLDGIDAGVVVNHDVSLSPVNNLTVEMWLRPDSDPDCDGNNNWRLLLAKADIGGPYSLVLEDDLTLKGWVRVNDLLYEVSSGQGIAVGAWSHVAFTYQGDTGEMAFFVDGEETNRVSAASGTLDSSLASVAIGAPASSGGNACPNGTGGFHGAIDEVRISNVVRWNASPPPPTPTPTSTPGPNPTPTPDGANPGDDGPLPGCSCDLSAPARLPAASLVLLVLGLALAVRRRR